MAITVANQFQHIRATFCPRRVDDLKPDAIPHVGQTFEWMAAWPITEEDGGPYVGEWAMTLAYRSDGAPNINFGWVPSGDLVIADQQEEKQCLTG